jgi:hypothetical protein
MPTFPQRTFADLSPTEFENFAYDVLSLSNVRNLTWRTPGADGGRDIEGEVFIRDLSGFSTRQRWYFECKRYSSSLDWPLVYGKVAHADTNQADFLLIITNSTPSPNCETQISKWNTDRRSPMIRVWRGYELESIVDQFPSVAAKYGLRHPPPATAGEFLNIALEISKITQTAYSAFVLGIDALPPIEAASALSELFSARAQNIAHYGKFISLPVDDNAANDLYPWVDTTVPMTMSATSLRACLAVYKFVTAAHRLQITSNQEAYIVTPLGGRQRELSEAARNLIALVATWSDLELQFRGDDTLRLKSR